MSTPSYFELGYFLKPVGLKGNVKVQLSSSLEADFSTLETLFVKENGQFIPYFVESIDRKGDILNIAIEDIDSPEQAKAFRKKTFYIEATEDIKTAQLDLSGQDLIGYAAFDGDNYIGDIDSIDAYPSQTMATIKHKGEEVLIPLNQAFVKSIDDDEKVILFSLPDGLLDL